MFNLGGQDCLSDQREAPPENPGWQSPPGTYLMYSTYSTRLQTLKLACLKKEDTISVPNVRKRMVDRENYRRIDFFYEMPLFFRKEENRYRKNNLRKG